MLSLKEIEIISSEQSKRKVKCKCGHTVLIPKNKDKYICSWCKKYVFKNSKDEFEYRIKENLYKAKRNTN